MCEPGKEALVTRRIQCGAAFLGVSPPPNGGYSHTGCPQGQCFDPFWPGKNCSLQVLTSHLFAFIKYFHKIERKASVFWQFGGVPPNGNGREQRMGKAWREGVPALPGASTAPCPMTVVRVPSSCAIFLCPCFPCFPCWPASADPSVGPEAPSVLGYSRDT